MRKKKILVACGTAIATSTVVARKISELLAAKGYSVNIDQCRSAEVPGKLHGVDLIVTTTQAPLNGTGAIPVIQTISFLTGVGMEADIEKIISFIKE
ncbi:MAG: PTS sugar transporter subunit IIB [Spirochaetales bacterium]|jgi:PTS system galactitol-specific IIB component|nr:PTS sugar transporter subunit IIB [Spirochaetales bacterium]